MSSLADEKRDWVRRLAEACGRLVHPAVTAPEERLRQQRFLGVALAGPFLVAGGFAQVLSTPAGIPAMLAAICLVIVCGWTAAVAVAQTGRRAAAELATLFLTAVPVAVLVQSAGGAASPLFLAWLPLIVEAAYVGRSRRAVLAGCAAAALSLALALALSVAMPMQTVPAAWHWLLPIAYAATLWLRRGALLAAASAQPAESSRAELEDLLSAVVLRYGKSGEIADASWQARDILGVEPDFLLGEGVFQRLHVADRVAYLHALADMREGAPRREVDMRLRVPADAGRAGGVVYRAFRLEMVQSGDAVLGILRDNSELARLREETAAAASRAEDSQMRLLATVSHELRTPLNAMLGFSEMLLEDMAGPLANARQREYVGLVREAGHHVLAVVNAVLDMAKIEAGTYQISRERFAFEEALETCTGIVTCQARGKGIALHDETEGRIGDIVTDRRALQQILINLLSNAVKFTPEGGEVSVGARLSGGRLELWVADTGIGIAADDLPRLGRPFVQVLNDHTRGFEGTGLGLALVKGLVACQGGSMEIESAPGMGTTVTIGLPLGEAGTDRAEDGRPAGHRLRGKMREQADEALRKTA